jgi:hypothetical protein
MKPHRFDPVSFVTGLVITLLGLAFLIPQTPLDIVDVVTSFGTWFWPAVLLVIGIAVLVPVFVPSSTDEEDGPLVH